MDDILLLQTVERYLQGKMQPDEKSFFEEHRKNVPEVDQLVVEHSIFLHQMEDFAANQNLKHSLHEVHGKLLETGAINEGGELSVKGKVINIWNKYRKVMSIAAAVGGGIALITSALFAVLAPSNQQVIEQLGQKVERLEKGQQFQGKKINEVASKIPVNAEVSGGGSGFLIDGKGYIATNAHILNGANFANVYNNGKEFRTRIIYKDEARDIAILKIEDEDFTPYKTLPYGISKSAGDLGEEIFTLGYPKNEIVYNMGYFSAKTGHNGDTLSCQVQMNSNHGNSGGPIFNKYGEIIGVLSTRDKTADGVTFAITSKYIYRVIDEIKKSDTSVQKIKMPTYSAIRSLDRVNQIKKIEDFVFLIKAYK